MTGGETTRLIPDMQTGIYHDEAVTCHTLMKVETHNHPTGVCPHQGQQALVVKFVMKAQQVSVLT